MDSADRLPSALTESMLEAMPIGVAIIDTDLRVVLINSAYCASIDVPPNSFLPGMKLQDVLRASANRAGGPESQVATRLTTSLATLRAGFAAFSPHQRLLFSNPRFAELLGLPPEPLPLALPFGELLHRMATYGEFARAEDKAFLAAQHGIDRSRHSIVRRIRANGQVIDVGSDPLPDGGWTITVVDVTALAHAGDAERRRAALLHSILDAIPHGLCVCSADRRVTMFNRAYGELMAGAPIAVGDRVEDVIRRRAAAGEYGPGDPEEVFAQQMAFDVTRPQMRKRRRPNGLTIDVRTSPLPDGGYISVVTDITPLTEAETEASRRAQELAIMLGCIQHGVLLWGPDRRLVASNAIAAELLHHPTGLLTPGRSEDEILASMMQRGHFGRGEAAQEAARALSSLDRSGPYLRQVTTISGRVLDVRSDPTPAGGWVSTFTDVTEARAAEEELRRAKSAAEAANRAKSRFLATMSHELRTPLNLIIGFSDTLLREAANPSRARITEFAEQINDAGRHLLDMINVILDVARVEAGRFDLADDEVDIRRLVHLCVRQSDAVAQAAEIALSIDLPDGLPLVQADERRLQQVLNHLLSNAIKFTHAGGIVSIGASVTPGVGLTLFVRDTGIGIPPDELERVFEPFTQVDGDLSRRFQGAGLGLYMSRALVAGHGGELVLSSQRGEGTIVEIRLPEARLIRPGEVSFGDGAR